MVNGLVAPRPCEILIVDDGSRDGTGARADRLADQHPGVHVVHHPVNQGFSGAMLSCFRKSQGEWIFLAPADGQVPIAEVLRFLERSEGQDIVIGVRNHRRDALHRRLLSRGFHMLARAMFGLPQREFSSAFLFRRALFADMTLRSRPNSASILPEVLYRAGLRGARITELTVAHRPRLGGRAKGGDFSVIARTLVEMARLAIVIRLEGRRGSTTR